MQTINKIHSLLASANNFKKIILKNIRLENTVFLNSLEINIKTSFKNKKLAVAASSSATSIPNFICQKSKTDTIDITQLHQG